MEKYLLDSVILIDFLNKKPEAEAFLELAFQDSAISVITRLEVLTGLSGERWEIGKVTLERFHTHEVGIQAADLAADYRQQYRWKLADSIQAAIARLNNLLLVTRNTKDFSPSRHPFVLVPYK